MRSAAALTLSCLVATLLCPPPSDAGSSTASLSFSSYSFGARPKQQQSANSIAGFLGDEKIVGGTATSIVLHPYMVSVEKYFTFVPKWFHNCGGTVINHYNILSAAHCIQDEPKAAYRVRAGSSVRGRGGVVVTVAKVFYHPKFNPTALDYDVGVFRLKSSLAYGLAIQPIHFPKIGSTPRTNTKFNIIGWGAEQTMAFEYPHTLRQTQVSKVDQATCAKDYKKIRAVSERMICAAGPGKDTCTGDSGGPLLSVRQTSSAVIQYGIVSWGEACAQQNEPGVYCSLTNAEIRAYISKTLRTK